MGKSLLQIIAEAKLLADKQKNIQNNPYIENSEFKEYANDFGTYQGINYSNDSNKSNDKNLVQIGKETLQDVKDLNVLQPEFYEQVDFYSNDVSVIDMPEIEEVSPQFWAQQIKYNKWANLEYILTDIPDAPPVIQESETYYEYIQRIKESLDIRNIPLIDVFSGVFDFEDTPLGEIGAKTLNEMLLLQLQQNIKIETLGRVNLQPLSIAKTGVYYRDDFDISVPQDPAEKKAEFISRLAGVEIPISFLPNGMFGLERNKYKYPDGTLRWLGEEMASAQRIQLQLQYTGKGQQKVLIEGLKLNQYNEFIEGVDESLDANYYLNPENSIIGGTNTSNGINNREFVLNDDNSVGFTGVISEYYGINSIQKDTTNPEMFSDKYHWSWAEDAASDATHEIGWTLTRTNPFAKKTLLGKTQDIVNQYSNIGAFLDLKAKEFKEVKNDEINIISRGDGTTASGDYIDDDGTPIKKDEYFRVWTKDRGYTKLSRTLRHRDLDNEDKRSVLNDNGLVNFAPTLRRAGVDVELGTLINEDIIKRYMFSIENLAWNDFINDLPLCEQGVGDPVTGHRGRIMWFPPYDLEITEDVSVNWESHQFIGRGEPIFTYNNTTRSASLKFAIIVDYPAIVQQLTGKRTEFWERYFKGDKLVQNEAIANNLLKNRLSKNELNEIEKRRKIAQPIPQKSDKPNITEKQKDQNVVNETKKREEDNELGFLATSIYFPNDVTVIPISGFLNSTDVTHSASDLAQFIRENQVYVKREDLTIPILKQYNLGYEDGGIAFKENLRTVDGIFVDTSNGINYRKIKDNIPTEVSLNGNFTYRNSVLFNKKTANQEKCENNVIGYPDNTNFSKNFSFYFRWQWIFYDLLKSAKKVQVTCVGNASAAIPTVKDNYKLSLERAENALQWFKTFVVPQMRNAGLEIEYIYPPATYKADSEDKDAKAQDTNNEFAQEYCTDCNTADKKACKRTRRADIYIKILDENAPSPDPIVPTDDTPENNIITDPQLITDDSQSDEDPLDNNTLPPIDPSIINKLIYTECDFFEYLEINQPTQYQTISERIKYFHPAYHSMTPQGFNSRLNFLHQCTRQSDSIGRDGIENWKNLAFGRPPICILRIGDFYHTRCIIENYSISYSNGMTWDLNPEGIGVQPMYADITLSLKLLGGSSMTAPINRLQNALSFNYYANTEMFDARADSVVFKELPNDKNAVGSEGLDAAMTKVKNAQIVDGIRLSTIANYTTAEQERRLAEVRKQSRITLQNSITSPATPQQIEQFGQPESLLEAKKRLGIPLSTSDKNRLRVLETTNGLFSVDNISPTIQSEINGSLNSSLETKTSPLNLALTVGNDTNNIESSKNIMLQYLNQSVGDTTQISDADLTQITKDYLESYDKLYIQMIYNIN